MNYSNTFKKDVVVTNLNSQWNITSGNAHDSLNVKIKNVTTRTIYAGLKPRKFHTTNERSKFPTFTLNLKIPVIARINLKIKILQLKEKPYSNRQYL